MTGDHLAGLRSFFSPRPQVDAAGDDCIREGVRAILLITVVPSKDELDIQAGGAGRLVCP